ncbi:MAG TPA: SRPBCC family protein [Solirubrobacterales bacterium]|nr:SRPBCC family protein [Solirubrobacterales bacterium]
MGPVSAEVEIDASREQVYAALADLAVRPSFTDHFQIGFHLTRLDPVGAGAGARYRVKAPFRKVWMDAAIVSVDEPYRIVEEGQAGRGNRIGNHVVWELKDGPGPLTTVRVTHWTEPTHVDRALEIASAGSFWLERGWRRALRRLRDLLESDRPVAERVAVAGGNRYATGIP